MKVYLVGAGPGNRDLLTLRAVECLGKADLVVYDQLVPEGILDFAPGRAERICVKELGEHHAQRGQVVHEIMIAAAKEGKCVVRLKGGDPLVFGRGGEEAEILSQQDIPFEIVPGVTAALGAAAYAGIPLTHRLHASAVAFITGHEDPLKPESALDWPSIAHFSGTLVFYMGFGRLGHIVQSLVEHGKDPLTPSAAVQLATTGRQRSVEASLFELPEKVRVEGLASPAVIFVGAVVDMRAHRNWFERQPLFGKRVLVTRPRVQGRETVEHLERLGADPMLMPVIEIRAPADWAPVDRALTAVASYDWLVFTSANGVHSVLNRLAALGKDMRSLGPVRLAAIGPATSNALRSYRLIPDLVPSEYRSEILAKALEERVRGKRVLLARADRGREVLREELQKVAAAVDEISVYSQVDSLDSNPSAAEAIRSGGIDYVLVTSSNIARALVRRLDSAGRKWIEIGRTKLVSISPVTSDTIRELGLPVSAEATEYTEEGITRAVVQLAAPRQSANECREGHSNSGTPANRRRG